MLPFYPLELAEVVEVMMSLLVVDRAKEMKLCSELRQTTANALRKSLHNRRVRMHVTYR